MSEDTSLLDLIRTDNKLLSKLLVSVAVLCEEIHLLVTEAQNDYYPSLVCYEEGITHSIYINTIICFVKF